MKKVVLVVIVLFCCMCVFANGGKESKKVDTKYSSVGVVGKTLQGIGTVYSQATRAIVLALHPFPNILTKFYGYVEGVYGSTYGGEFSSDMLLTSKNYYTSSGYTQVDADKDTGQAIVTAGSDAKLTISETNASTSELQKTRWTVTSYLFIIFFVAEVIFTAVFGYIAPQDENASLLRQIGVSAAMTLMLFILASALPFLVEAVRFGLFQIANLYTPVTFDSMFDMPAKFMWDMSSLMETLSWRNDASPLFNNNSSSLTTALLGSVLATVIYIVFEFVMGLQAIKAGLHIFSNIIEVYLLLSIVMILLPISVFTPLKGVSRKCVYSLLSNLIECFVLCFIVILVVPACIAGCSNLESLMDDLRNAQKNTMTLLAKQELTFKDGTEIDVDWTLNFYAQGEDYVVVLSWVTAEESDKMVMYLSEDSALYNTHKGGNNMQWSQAGATAFVSPDSYEYSNRATYFLEEAKAVLSRFRYASHNWSAYRHQMSQMSAWATKIESTGGLPSVLECINGGKDYVKQIFWDKNATESDETYAANSTLISSLLIAWVFLYLPCFFVMQSTQITNALSNGTAGHESFANALSHTGGQMMQAVTTGANLVKAGVSMAATASSLANSKGMASDISSIQDTMQKQANKEGDNE